MRRVAARHVSGRAIAGATVGAAAATAAWKPLHRPRPPLHLLPPAMMDAFGLYLIWVVAAPTPSEPWGVARDAAGTGRARSVCRVA